MKWISVCMLYKSGNCDVSELICFMSSWRIEKCLKIFNTLFPFCNALMYSDDIFSLPKYFVKCSITHCTIHKVFGKTFTLQILYSFSPNRIEGIIQVEDQANNNEHFSHCPVYPDHHFTLSTQHLLYIVLSCILYIMCALYTLWIFRQITRSSREGVKKIGKI